MKSSSRRYGRTVPLYIMMSAFLAVIHVITGCIREPAAPNIIYILADDLGYGDLSCYNSSSGISTPQIDRLAAEGMRCTDMHAPSSVCTPTRYGILTGSYCWRSRLPLGVLQGTGQTFIPDDQFTVARMLQQQGYRTGVVGKWHLGIDWALKHPLDTILSDPATTTSIHGVIKNMAMHHIDFDVPPTRGPNDFGFDYSYVLPASLDMAPYCYLEDGLLVEPLDSHTVGHDLNTGYTEAFWRAGPISSSFRFDQVLPTFIDKGIAFIKESTQRDEPFFMYLPLAAPHTPWVPTAAFTSSSTAGTYGDFVSMVDHQVGRVIQLLDDLSISDHTLIIFTSDNGPYWTPELIERYGHRAAGPHRGMKADAYEGGHRVPYLARWPAEIEAGRVHQGLASLTHLAATVADITGAIIPAGQALDSHSLYAAMLGQQSVYHPIICHSSRGYHALRDSSWLYIEGLGSGGFSQPSIIPTPDGGVAGQLYDLRTSQDVDLYNALPDRARRMSQMLDSLRR